MMWVFIVVGVLLVDDSVGDGLVCCWCLGGVGNVGWYLGFILCCWK